MTTRWWTTPLLRLSVGLMVPGFAGLLPEYPGLLPAYPPFWTGKTPTRRLGGRRCLFVASGLPDQVRAVRRRADRGSGSGGGGGGGGGSGFGGGGLGGGFGGGFGLRMPTQLLTQDTRPPTNPTVPHKTTLLSAAKALLPLSERLPPLASSGSVASRG